MHAFVGKNEFKQNKMHLKAEKRRKEIAESSSYKVSTIICSSYQ